MEGIEVDEIISVDYKLMGNYIILHYQYHIMYL